MLLSDTSMAKFAVDDDDDDFLEALEVAPV